MIRWLYKKWPNLVKVYQSETLNLIAVKSDWRVLRHIKEPSKPVMLAAVRQNGFALKYVKYPWVTLCYLAVNTTPEAIDQVKDKRVREAILSRKKPDDVWSQVRKRGFR